MWMFARFVGTGYFISFSYIIMVDLMVYLQLAHPHSQKMGLAASYFFQSSIGESPRYTFQEPMTAQTVEAFKVHRDCMYREHRNKAIVYAICTIVTAIGVVYLRKNGKDAF